MRCSTCPEFCSVIQHGEVVGLAPGHPFSDCGGAQDDDHVVAGSVVDEDVLAVRLEESRSKDPGPIDVAQVVASIPDSIPDQCLCADCSRGEAPSGHVIVEEDECSDPACPYLPSGSHFRCTCNLDARAACAACIDRETDERVKGWDLPRKIIVQLEPGKFAVAQLDWYGDCAVEAGVSRKIDPEVFRIVGEPVSLEEAAAQIEERRQGS